MRQSSRKPFGLAQFGVLILLLSFIGVPLVQFLSGNPMSEAWTALNFIVLGGGIAVLIGLPWYRARPIKRLRDEQLVKDPNSTCLIVAQIDERGVPGGLALFTANKNGISIRSSKEESVSLTWGDINEIKESSSSDKRLDVIEVKGPRIEPSYHFVPMTTSGMSKVRQWDIAGYVTQINRARTSASD